MEPPDEFHTELIDTVHKEATRHRAGFEHNGYPNPRVAAVQLQEEVGSLREKLHRDFLFFKVDRHFHCFYWGIKLINFSVDREQLSEFSLVKGD